MAALCCLHMPALQEDATSTPRAFRLSILSAARHWLHSLPLNVQHPIWTPELSSCACDAEPCVENPTRRPQVVLFDNDRLLEAAAEANNFNVNSQYRMSTQNATCISARRWCCSTTTTTTGCWRCRRRRQRLWVPPCMRGPLPACGCGSANLPKEITQLFSEPPCHRSP